MKRCVFAGPSLHGVLDRPAEIDFRPPARVGDIVGAVREGFQWIGLIDGYFGSCASVWHKEILYALSIGCHVHGAASMGALRAAECQAFGMRPVGEIAAMYADGRINDDADVALLHGPAEVDYAPLTEPMVDVDATLNAMAAAGVVSDQEHRSLKLSARSLHFQDRTVDSMVAGAILSQQRMVELAGLFEVHRVRQKQIDAALLVSEMRTGLPFDQSTSSPWSLVHSQSLSTLLGA